MGRGAAHGGVRARAGGRGAASAAAARGQGGRAGAGEEGQPVAAEAE